MREYKVIRVVAEVYFIEANNKQEAIQKVNMSNDADMCTIKSIKATTIKSLKNEK